MLKTILNIKDTGLTRETVTGHHLLIQLGDQFYGFVLYHPDKKKVAAWSFYQSTNENGHLLTDGEMQLLLKEHEWLNWDFDKVYQVSYSSRNTLVPSQVTDPNVSSLYPGLMYGIQPNEEIQKDIVPEADASNYYSLSSGLSSLLKEIFPSAKRYHLYSLFMCQRASDAAVITASVYLKSICITVEMEGKWRLLQTYPYQTPEDVLYIVLNCFVQLQLNADTTEIRIEGMIDPQSAMAKLLAQYLNNLFWKEDLVYEYPSTENPLPLHTLALTDRILSCVS